MTPEQEKQFREEAEREFPNPKTSSMGQGLVNWEALATSIVEVQRLAYIAGRSKSSAEIEALEHKVSYYQLEAAHEHADCLKLEKERDALREADRWIPVTKDNFLTCEVHAINKYGDQLIGYLFVNENGILSCSTDESGLGTHIWYVTHYRLKLLPAPPTE